MFLLWIKFVSWHYYFVTEYFLENSAAVRLINLSEIGKHTNASCLVGLFGSFSDFSFLALKRICNRRWRCSESQGQTDGR